jgi:replication factor A1
MAMSFDEIVQKIVDGAGLSHDDLMEKIKRKREDLGGLVTPEGAASIIAKELKIDIGRGELAVRTLHIEDLAPEMSKIDIIARVVRVQEPKEFQRKDGETGLRGGLLLGDKTGFIRLVLWDEKAAVLRERQITKGDAVRVHNAYVKMAIDKQPELNLGSRGTITVNPDDPAVKDLPVFVGTAVKISELKPEMREADVIGRVTATSKVRTFERQDGGSGKVSTVTVADSTGSIRVSLWDEWAGFAERLSQGDVIKLENAMVKVGFRGQTELSLGSRGRIVQNPAEAADVPPISMRPLKINEIEADMPSLDLVARVRRSFPTTEFKRTDGTMGKVSSLVLVDETGTIRASFWDSATDVVKDLKGNEIISLKNVYSRTGLGEVPEVHVGRNSTVEINPPGVDVSEQPALTKIEKIEPNMQSLDVVGKVLGVYPLKEFTRADGSPGKVSSVKIADETGPIRVSLWNENAPRVSEMKEGDVVKFTDVYSTLGLGGMPELQMSRRGKVEINPPGEKMPFVDETKTAAPSLPRSRIGEIEREGVRVKTRGTVVHVFHRKPLFTVCPSCGASLGGAEASLACPECGKTVAPEKRLIVSFLLDDGTDNIRVSLFGKVAEQLLQMNADQVFKIFNETPDLVQFYDKIGLRGKEILVTGTARHDKFSDQLELRGYEVSAPDPKEEAKILLQEIKETSSKEGGNLDSQG